MQIHRQALRYLRGEIEGGDGLSPVDMVDVHDEETMPMLQTRRLSQEHVQRSALTSFPAQDQGRSFSDENNPNCRPASTC